MRNRNFWCNRLAAGCGCGADDGPLRRPSSNGVFSARVNIRPSFCQPIAHLSSVLKNCVTSIVDGEISPGVIFVAVLSALAAECYSHVIVRMLFCFVFA